MPIILVLIAIPALLVGFISVSLMAGEIGFGSALAAATVLGLLSFIVVEMMKEAQHEDH